MIQQLKQRIVDIVKSDAQTQYSEDLRQRLTSTTSKLLDGNKGKKFLGKITVGVKKLGKSVGGRLAKESRVKDFETKASRASKKPQKVKKLVAENLSLLTTRMKNQEVSVGPDGKTRINFIKTEDIPDISPAQTERLQEFNEAASRFAEKPYEWGLEKSGKHRKAYDDAKFEYEKTRNEVLTMMQSKEKTGEDTATANMLRVENSLKMEQLATPTQK